jgi:DNA primase
LTEDRVALKQRIKEANDIVDVVGSYISLRPLGPTFKGLCPFHDDHRPSFDVDPRRQRYRCWACNKYGDVINFVQEFEHVGFLEALELLARRAGITLENLEKSPQGPSRASMLDVMRWAQSQFQECLLEAPHADVARTYLGERKLAGETVRRFGLGFAPGMGEWLVSKALNAKMPADLLETLGLIAKRNEGRGYYDRFRDRVMFPIRDIRGQTVGFGGRILPSSPLAERSPKYYNSAETPLFSKSEQLYGIDLAREAAAKIGYLAIVEGYTDVMMAHQYGVSHVVATMGTALNARHIKKIRNLVSRVVLVFDADAGGDTGVDRALELFVSHDLDLRIATLPEGLDPCDFLTAHGPEPFRRALDESLDVLEFKLRSVWPDGAQPEVESLRRAADQMLSILAASPKDELKLGLMVNRIAHRLRLKEETLWKKFRELRARRADGPSAATRVAEAVVEPERSAPAARHEIELLEVLLAEPVLVGKASAEVGLIELEHPGLRTILDGLYRLHAEGLPADLDHLHGRLDNERLLDFALRWQDQGLLIADRQSAYAKVLARFRERRDTRRQQELKNQVLAANDHNAAIQLLAKLKQNK